MAVRNRQIGWSNKSNLLYGVLRELNALKGQFAIPTTTTTTTTAIIDSSLTIDVSGVEYIYDIPFSGCSFGCWINMANDNGFPRIFSFGAYPSASQAISIEGGTLYFWYNGGIEIAYSMTSYIGNWVWVALQGTSLGGASLWIDGVNVATAAPSTIGSLSSTLYIGSENAPDTYYDGLMAGVIFDYADLRFPPTAPLITGPNTCLLIGQGTNLTQQLTDQGVLSRTIVNSNCTYSTESPYSPAVGGSIKFGA